MNLTGLKNLSSQSLLEKLKSLVSDERHITAEILHHLKELESRKLHLQMGYSSLFEYATKELKYSESQAQRRISAMRLLKEVPELEQKIKEGSISLTSAAKIQSFIYQSKKENKPLNLQNKKDLVEKLENKSSKECELEFIKLSPEPFIVKEKEKILSEEYTELKIVLKKELKHKLEKVKSLLSHSNSNPTYHELLELMCDVVINKKEQRKAYSLRINTASRPSQKLFRYIPSTIKTEVYMRDKGCCSYKDSLTGKRCVSKHLLQYDHIKPLSFGGPTTVQNLRLLCFNHHKYVTEKVFGYRFRNL